MGPSLTLSFSFYCQQLSQSLSLWGQCALHEHPACQTLEEDCSCPQARIFLASSHSQCWPIRDAVRTPPCQGSLSKMLKLGHALDNRVSCKQIYPPSSMPVPHSPNSKCVFHLAVSYIYSRLGTLGFFYSKMKVNKTHVGCHDFRE